MSIATAQPARGTSVARRPAFEWHPGTGQCWRSSQASPFSECPGEEHIKSLREDITRRAETAWLGEPAHRARSHVRTHPGCSITPEEIHAVRSQVAIDIFYASFANEVNNNKSHISTLCRGCFWGWDMLGAASRGAIVCAALCLGSCTSLNVIHDPHPFLDRQHVPNPLKSMRCELITYIEANRQRRNLFYMLRNFDRTYAFANFPHYELSEKQFGLIVLDVKVQDTVGVGATIDPLNTVDAATTRTWHFGPTAGNQNTYELN